MKQNKTICIDSELVEKLKKEVNCSLLINKLLLEHYSVVKKDINKLIEEKSKELGKLKEEQNDADLDKQLETKEELDVKIEKDRNEINRLIEIKARTILMYSNMSKEQAEIMATEYINYNRVIPMTVKDWLIKMGVKLITK